MFLIIPIIHPSIHPSHTRAKGVKAVITEEERDRGRNRNTKNDGKANKTKQSKILPQPPHHLQKGRVPVQQGYNATSHPSSTSVFSSSYASIRNAAIFILVLRKRYHKTSVVIVTLISYPSSCSSSCSSPSWVWPRHSPRRLPLRLGCQAW